MKRKFGFRGRMKDVSEKRKKGNSYGYLILPKGVDLFQLEKNTCKIEMDILPYLVTDKKHADRDVGAEEGVYWFKRPFKAHRNVGVMHTSIVCPTTFGKPCPICEYKRELYKSDNNEDEIAELKTTNKNLYAVIIKKIDKERIDEQHVQLFEFSDYLFQQVLEEQLEEDDRLDTFALPDEGSSLYVRFSEETFGKNKYPKPTRFELVEREKQYDESILDKVPNLDECLNLLSYDEIKNMFFNVEETDDKTDDETEDETEDEPEEEKHEVKRGFRKREKVEEEEDEEKKDDEEPPVKRTRKNSKPDTRCPFGHKFGEDYDAFEDCDECDVWRDCRKENKN